MTTAGTLRERRQAIVQRHMDAENDGDKLINEKVYFDFAAVQRQLSA